MRIPKYIQVFNLLHDEAERARKGAQPPFNHDLIVGDPAQFLERKMRIGHANVLQYLNRLEGVGAIALVRTGAGQYLQSARILKESIDYARHETEESDRLMNVLRQHKRRLQ